jgi:adenylate kinase family enzyme
VTAQTAETDAPSVAARHVDVSRMRRVVVVGTYGAGKSTLAAELGRLLQLPVRHLDALRWDPGWKLLPQREWEELLDRLVAEDEWIIDGNFERTLPPRLRRADTVVFLDAPLAGSLWRTVRRRLSRGERPDLAPGLEEKLNLALIRLFARYRREVRPQLAELVRAHAEGRQVVVLRRRSQVREFVADVRSQAG